MPSKTISGTTNDQGFATLTVTNAQGSQDSIVLADFETDPEVNLFSHAGAVSAPGTRDNEHYKSGFYALKFILDSNESVNGLIQNDENHQLNINASSITDGSQM